MLNKKGVMTQLNNEERRVLTGIFHIVLEVQRLLNL